MKIYNYTISYNYIIYIDCLFVLFAGDKVIDKSDEVSAYLLRLLLMRLITPGPS